MKSKIALFLFVVITALILMCGTGGYAAPGSGPGELREIVWTPNGKQVCRTGEVTRGTDRHKYFLKMEVMSKTRPPEGGGCATFFSKGRDLPGSIGCKRGICITT
jgi:hypothetical protein